MKWKRTIIELPALATKSYVVLFDHDGHVIASVSSARVADAVHEQHLIDGMRRWAWGRWVVKAISRCVERYKDEWDKKIDTFSHSLRLRQKYARKEDGIQRNGHGHRVLLRDDWDDAIKYMIDQGCGAALRSQESGWTRWIYNVVKNHERKDYIKGDRCD